MSVVMAKEKHGAQPDRIKIERKMTRVDGLETNRISNGNGSNVSFYVPGKMTSTYIITAGEPDSSSFSKKTTKSLPAV